jgi:four helix bundle protein
MSQIGQKTNKINNFQDLNAWKNGHQLVLEIYRVTKKFPREEIFGLTNQLRRAAVSITSNIAEGFSRNYYKEKVQFYHQALGSVTEVQNQLIIAKDISYLTLDEFNEIFELTVCLHKIQNGLIRKSKEIIRETS